VLKWHTNLLLGKTRRDWSCGSLLLHHKQRTISTRLTMSFNIREAGQLARIGMLSLFAAVGLLAVASIYRTSKER